jgi:hypothetical protein
MQCQMGRKRQALDACRCLRPDIKKEPELLPVLFFPREREIYMDCAWEAFFRVALAGLPARPLLATNLNFSSQSQETAALSVARNFFLLFTESKLQIIDADQSHMVA